MLKPYIWKLPYNKMVLVVEQREMTGEPAQPQALRRAGSPPGAHGGERALWAAGQEGQGAAWQVLPQQLPTSLLSLIPNMALKCQIPQISLKNEIGDG